VRSSVSYALPEQVEHLTLTGSAATRAMGNALDNRLSGNAAGNRIDAAAGKDTLTGGAGDDSLDGGAGLDQALFSSSWAAYTLAETEVGYTISDASGSDGSDTLSQVERLGFADANLAFDLDGSAGQVYRLYKAAFARTPDLAGLGGWIKAVDDGLSLEQVAAAFAVSAEFQSLYGSSTSNEQFVMLLYLNALGRAPEAGGVSGWAGQLALGAITRAQLLVQFSESAENKAAVQSSIAGGILFANAEQAAGPARGQSFSGTAGADSLIGSVGKDSFTGGLGNDSIKGGAGLDQAFYSGNRANYTLSANAGTLTVAGGADGSDTLSQVERIRFADTALAFDLEGNAGQTYRLYQAAFDRTPDTQGLSDWMRGMDGGMTLAQVAHGFIGSAEFQGLYGASPSDQAFVTLLYQNVLNRAPDAGGQAYWLDELGRGVTRETVLIGFSESAENQAALIGVMQDGIEYVAG
jgi:Ca2+-binding RTX toxin-like protein